MSLESQLGDFLYSYEKLIVLGVGNVLKCDDGVGPFIIKKLKDEGIETYPEIGRASCRERV